ncbi:MAG: thioether cross-link-forming SCIFF peptide maturase [Firmicutes bacterium]|nr:thioether cross-link-forming SCIFF peptide maturase [Bacillota bacterium]
MIHQYKLNGYNIVLDVYSGSVHVVDEVAYDIIAMYETASEAEIIQAMMEKYGDQDDVNEEEIKECISDIETLKAAKKLFSEDLYQGIAMDFKNKSKDIKALCLHVAHSCNLNCEYCFASQGKYHGERALMSFEVGKQALDFLIANSGDHVNLEVDFFGGEPLMNWDVVKQLVEYARAIEKDHGKHFRFTLTTNGVDVDDEVMDFANQHMHNVVMSIDGRKEVHDHLRKDYQGNGSYDIIVPKFQEFARRREERDYYVRGTFTHHNTDFTKDILHMADLGFTKLSMEPVVCSEDDPYALTREDLPVLFEQYEILAKEMLKRQKEGRPITFYHYMIDLTHGPCIHKRIAGCGSGIEYFAVTPWGDLYPCHQFVGDEAYLMGNVWDGVTNRDMQENFRHCNVYARKECDTCWARLYCSGGCAANAYHATGDIRGVYEYGCELFRKRMECAIMLKVAEQKEVI